MTWQVQNISIIGYNQITHIFYLYGSYTPFFKKLNICNYLFIYLHVHLYLHDWSDFLEYGRQFLFLFFFNQWSGLFSFFFFFLSFGGARVQTHGLMHARQVLYHWVTVPTQKNFLKLSIVVCTCLPGTWAAEGRFLKPRSQKFETRQCKIATPPSQNKQIKDFKI